MDSGLRIPSAKSVYEQRKTYSTSSIVREETSKYHVEHLTTMVMDKKVGVASIEDGINKLKQLDNRGQIWVQDMVMQVDEDAVCLIDTECKDELDKYPVGMIQVCTSFMQEPPYVSVLALVCWNEQQRKHHLHLFHCEAIKADLIQSDIESAITDRMSGNVKKRPETLRNNADKLSEMEPSCDPETDPDVVPDVVVPPPKQPDVDDISLPQLPGTPSQSEKKSRIAAWTASVANREFDLTSGSSMEAEDGQDMDVRKMNRDTAILMQLMEEIKVFVFNLDNISTDEKDSVKQKKKNEGSTITPGEDPGPAVEKDVPTQEEFLDIFQKSKLALTLVANQKNRLQNPPAEDMVHSIFTSVDKNVNRTGGPEMASGVVSPLLTQETIDLLEDHVIPEERLLWESLGNAWNTSREKWPEDDPVQEFTPKFTNGWEPPSLLATEDDYNELCCPSDSVSMVEQKRQRQEQELEELTQELQEDDEKPLENDKCNDVHDAEIKEAKILAIALNTFSARNNTELPIHKNEIVWVNDHSKKSWQATKQGGRQGFVPYNYMKIIENPDPMQQAIFN